MKDAEEFTPTIPRKRPFKKVFQFKITLLGIKPPIWRRIQVPDSYTFYDLHVAIQDAMGWTDTHLHAYEISGQPPIRIDAPCDPDELDEAPDAFSTEIEVSTLLKQKGDKALYDYDFGDGWRHEVLLERILPKDSGTNYPICLDGKRACPPEDCGGPGGYLDCVKAASGGKPTKKTAELLEWLGDWQPEKFDPADIIFEDPRARFLQGYGEEGIWPV